MRCYQPFCYYCGVIGHVERFCDQKKENSRNEKIRDREYGEWMRANLIKIGKMGEHGLGVSRSESEKTITSHRMMKDWE